jgi:RNA polymerase sigma-70 factor, ECF subfamily
VEDLRNPTQFDNAYRRLRPLALSAANSVLRDEAAAEDVVQDVFVHLWRNPHAWDPKRGPLHRYVALLSRSRALDRWRTRGVRDAAVERSAEEARQERAWQEDAAEPVFRRERSRKLLHALEGLPSEQRSAVLLAFGRGLTAREIAVAERVPVGTAKSRVRLGLRKAHENLTAEAGGNLVAA